MENGANIRADCTAEGAATNNVSKRLFCAEKYASKHSIFKKKIKNWKEPIKR